jgi:hypothetical protein
MRWHVAPGSWYIELAVRAEVEYLILFNSPRPPDFVFFWW